MILGPGEKKPLAERERAAARKRGPIQKKIWAEAERQFPLFIRAECDLDYDSEIAAFALWSRYLGWIAENPAISAMTPQAFRIRCRLCFDHTSETYRPTIYAGLRLKGTPRKALLSEKRRTKMLLAEDSFERRYGKRENQV